MAVAMSGTAVAIGRAGVNVAMKSSILSLASMLAISVLLAGSDQTSAGTISPAGQGLWGNVLVQPDEFDCEDFETQEEAQAVLDEDPADPNNLDPNQDGIACALLPSADDTGTDPGDDSPTTQSDTGNLTPEERRAARRAARQQDQQPTAEEPTATTCADFETAEEAQAVFDADPEGLADLDPDGNGVACEEALSAESTPEAEPTTQARGERKRNRRNQAEEPAPTEVVIDEPATVRVREDFDCVDFELQEDAQAAYDEDPSDPYNLDPSGDGVACSSLPSSNPRVIQVPRTGVGGPAHHAAALLVAASLLAVLAGAGAVRSRRIPYDRRAETG